jgi:hypothetical protein
MLLTWLINRGRDGADCYYHTRVLLGGHYSGREFVKAVSYVVLSN